MTLPERYPNAELRLLPEAGQPDGHRKTQLILHSIVGSAEGAYGYFLNSTPLESTMILKKSGYAIQCMNLSDRADANGEANNSAISVETEDNGNPDKDPWTVPQIDWIVDFGVWLMNNGDVQPQRIPYARGSGVGYHVMFGAPGPWTQVTGKTCPGAIRIKQFHEVVMPRILAEFHAERDWFAMATKSDLKQAIREVQHESTFVMAIDGKQYRVDDTIRTASYIQDQVDLNTLVAEFGTRPSIDSTLFHAMYTVEAT